jgi:hypothetical protein
MRDMDSVLHVERLADEIHAQHVAMFRQADTVRGSRYSGIGNARRRNTYGSCEYVGKIRKLTVSEIAEFRAHVAACMKART